MVFGWQSNTGPVGWYRVEQPLANLAEQGYQTAHGMVLPDELMPGAAGDAELKSATTYLGQYVVGVAASRTWHALAEEGHRVFLELDDDPWSIDRSNPSHAEMSDPTWLARLSANLRVSTGVITTRKPLADVIRQHTDAPVYVIPNYIPEWLLSWKRPRHPATRHESGESVVMTSWRNNAMVVGWAGSSHHKMDWEHYSSRLVQWLNSTPLAILHVMGEAGYIGTHQRDFPAGRVFASGWNDGVENFYRRISFDVGVIPLRKHPFNMSKSPIAALIYAALGIPVVASDFGPYHDFVLHGETGFLFKSPGEMAQYLAYLVNDADLRATLGANARAVAAAHTYEKNAWKWASVLFPEESS